MRKVLLGLAFMSLFLVGISAPTQAQPAHQMVPAAPQSIESSMNCANSGLVFKNCLKISGSGLHVDYFQISRINGNYGTICNMSGNITVYATNGTLEGIYYADPNFGCTWYIMRLTAQWVEANYTNNSVACAYIYISGSLTPGYPCGTIHS